MVNNSVQPIQYFFKSIFLFWLHTSLLFGSQQQQTDQAFSQGNTEVPHNHNTQLQERVDQLEKKCAHLDDKLNKVIKQNQWLAQTNASLNQLLHDLYDGNIIHTPIPNKQVVNLRQQVPIIYYQQITNQGVCPSYDDYPTVQNINVANREYSLLSPMQPHTYTNNNVPTASPATSWNLNAPEFVFNKDDSKEQTAPEPDLPSTQESDSCGSLDQDENVALKPQLTTYNTSIINVKPTKQKQHNKPQKLPKNRFKKLVCIKQEKQFLEQFKNCFAGKFPAFLYHLNKKNHPRALELMLQTIHQLADESDTVSGYKMQILQHKKQKYYVLYKNMAFPKKGSRCGWEYIILTKSIKQIDKYQKFSSLNNKNITPFYLDRPLEQQPVMYVKCPILVWQENIKGYIKIRQNLRGIQGIPYVDFHSFRIEFLLILPKETNNRCFFQGLRTRFNIESGEYITMNKKIIKGIDDINRYVFESLGLYYLLYGVSYEPKTNTLYMNIERNDTPRIDIIKSVIRKVNIKSAISH